MKRMCACIALAGCLAIAACSDSSGSPADESKLFQEFRVEFTGSCASGTEENLAVRTLLSINDWRQVTMVTQSSEVGEDWQVTCSGVALLDESDYDKVVKAISDYGIFEYKDPDPNQDTIAMAGPEANVSYYRNDGTNNLFGERYFVLDPKIETFVNEIKTVACPKVMCAPLASENKSVGLLSKLHYHFNGAVVPTPVAVDIDLDDNKTLKYTATSYINFDEVAGTESCFTTISDADFQKIIDKVTAANLITYSPPGRDSSECELIVGAHTTEITYTQTDGKTNAFETYELCMSAEARALIDELETITKNNLPCANSVYRTDA